MPYYYLTASLPRLTLEDSPPFNMEEFREKCATILSRKDLLELDRILAGHPPVRSPFAMQWRNLDTQMRNALVHLRADRIGIESQKIQQEYHGFNITLEKETSYAYENTNPLEREQALDQYRWKLLEELGERDRFGLGCILSFALRLRIALRWASMNAEKGAQRLEKTISENLHNKLNYEPV